MEHKEFTLEEVVSDLYADIDMPQEEREQTVTEIIHMITETALLRSLDQSDKVTQNEFESLMAEKPHEDKLDDFIQGHFPDFQKNIAEELEIFQNLLLENTES